MEIAAATGPTITAAQTAAPEAAAQAAATEAAADEAAAEAAHAATARTGTAMLGVVRRAVCARVAAGMNVGFGQGIAEVRMYQARMGRALKCQACRCRQNAYAKKMKTHGTRPMKLRRENYGSARRNSNGFHDID